MISAPAREAIKFRIQIGNKIERVDTYPYWHQNDADPQHYEKDSVPGSVADPDPGSEIRDPRSGIRDPGWVKIRIRDKHPGSATLVPGGKDRPQVGRRSLWSQAGASQRQRTWR